MRSKFNSQCDKLASIDKKSKAINDKIGHFVIRQKIGSGGFAAVHKAFEKLTNTEIAVKIIQTEKFSQKVLNRMLRSFEINKKINHPNIAKIYEVVNSGSKYYVFMELVEGQQLFKTIVKNGPLLEANAVKIFHQICRAVKYLHENGIVHRDIKTQNIIVDSQFNAKLVDFDLANEFKLGQTSFFQTICGSHSYASPEILQRIRYNGQKVDIWCLGVTLFTMLQAKLPYDEDTKDNTKQNILKLTYKEPKLSSEEALQIYRNVFISQSNRIGLSELLNSKIFKKWGFLFQQQCQSSRDIEAHKIKTISKYLKIPEAEVHSQVQSRQLGPSYCIYQILLTQEGKKYRNQSYRIKSQTKPIKLEQYQNEKKESDSKLNKLMKTLNTRKYPESQKKRPIVNNPVSSEKKKMENLQSLDSKDLKSSKRSIFPYQQTVNKMEKNQNIFQVKFKKYTS